jgi:hypothetical protein
LWQIKFEKNKSPQVITTLQKQQKQMQHDVVDDFYDLHVQMEVHEEVMLEVQVT